MRCTNAKLLLLAVLAEMVGCGGGSESLAVKQPTEHVDVEAQEACQAWVRILIEEPGELPLEPGVEPVLVGRADYDGFHVSGVEWLVPSDIRSKAGETHFAYDIDTTRYDGGAIRCAGRFVASSAGPIEAGDVPDAKSLPEHGWHAVFGVVLDLVPGQDGMLARRATIITIREAWRATEEKRDYELLLGDPAVEEDLDGDGHKERVHLARAVQVISSPLAEDMLEYNPGSTLGEPYEESTEVKLLLIAGDDGHIVYREHYAQEYDASHLDSDCDPPTFQQPSYKIVDLGIGRAAFKYDELEGSVEEKIRCTQEGEDNQIVLEMDPVYLLFDLKSWTPVFEWKSSFEEGRPCDEYPWGGFVQPVQIAEGEPWEIHVIFDYDDDRLHREIWRYDGEMYVLAETKKGK